MFATFVAMALCQGEVQTMPPGALVRTGMSWEAVDGLLKEQPDMSIYAGHVFATYSANHVQVYYDQNMIAYKVKYHPPKPKAEVASAPKKTYR